MRIGLLGGSFDPVHRAHLVLAKTALTELRLNEVQLIPAGQPWQRPPLGASPAHRLAMLELAVGQTAGLRVNPIEINRTGPTYTVETLAQLPQAPEYFWILGADQLENFCTWRDWSVIASKVQLVVAQRPGSTLAAPAELDAWLTQNQRHLVHLPFDPLDVSANEIRQRIARGDSTHDLIPEAVGRYITEHGLYRQHAV
ncbi:MAG: nicotinate (nicotinamide) nucleotide adenylyltransferase [Alcaligenaceae bacterium]|jgi:nicotinate-nucleotide adenylyltransferase